MRVSWWNRYTADKWNGLTMYDRLDQIYTVGCHVALTFSHQKPRAASRQPPARHYPL